MSLLLHFLLTATQSPYWIFSQLFLLCCRERKTAFLHSHAFMCLCTSLASPSIAGRSYRAICETFANLFLSCSHISNLLFSYPLEQAEQLCSGRVQGTCQSSSQSPNALSLHYLSWCCFGASGWATSTSASLPSFLGTCPQNSKFCVASVYCPSWGWKRAKASCSSLVLTH